MRQAAKTLGVSRASIYRHLLAGVAAEAAVARTRTSAPGEWLPRRDRGRGGWSGVGRPPGTILRRGAGANGQGEEGE